MTPGESELGAIQRHTRVYRDLYANLPTTNVRVESLGFATDRLVLYRWSGAAWEELTIYASSADVGDRPTATDLPDGSLFYGRDTFLLYQVQAGAWVTITQTMTSEYGTHAAIPAAATRANGAFYYETDTNLLFQNQAAAWVQITKVSGWQLLATHTVNNENSISIGIAAHDLLKVEFNILGDPSNDGIIQLRLNNEAGADYDYLYIDAGALGIAANQTQFNLVDSIQAQYVAGKILITGRVSADDMARVRAMVTPAHYNDFQLLNGDNENIAPLTDITSIQFLMTPADMYSGKINVYGKNL